MFRTVLNEAIMDCRSDYKIYAASPIFRRVHLNYEYRLRIEDIVLIVAISIALIF